MKCSLIISNFLEEISSLSHSIFSSISFLCSLKKAFLPLLAILWNSAFRWIYLSFSPLPFTYLLFSAICKASSDNHFAFLHLFSLWMVLVIISCTMLQTSIHSSSDTRQSDLIPWIYLLLPLYNHKGFDLGHTWMTQWFFPTVFNLSLNFPITILKLNKANKQRNKR